MLNCNRNNYSPNLVTTSWRLWPSLSKTAIKQTSALQYHDDEDEKSQVKVQREQQRARNPLVMLFIPKVVYAKIK